MTDCSRTYPVAWEYPFAVQTLPEALNEICKYSRECLWDSALRLTRNPFDADDLVQETFFRVLHWLYNDIAKRGRDRSEFLWIWTLLLFPWMDHYPPFPYQIFTNERRCLCWLLRYQQDLYRIMKRRHYFHSTHSLDSNPLIR